MSANPPVNPAGQNAADKGIRKQERGFLDQLMQMLGNQFQNPAQFNFGAMPNAPAAQSNFNPTMQAPNIQAANMSYDPSGAFNQLQQAGAANVNFDVNKFWNSQQQPGQVQAGTVNFQGPQFDKQYMDQLTALIGQIGQAGQAPLQGLDPETAASLQAILTAQMGGINQQFDTDKEALINSLFGRGANRSTIALDQSGRLLYGRDQLANQAYSDDAQRQLQLRQYLRDFGMNALQTQAGFTGQQAGLQQEADLQSSAQKLQAMLANAARGQEASLANANLGMQQQQLGLQAGQLDLQSLLANAGFQQEANLFNAGQSNDLLQFITGLQQQGALANAGFQQEANVQNAQIGSQQQIATMQAGLAQSLQNAGFSQQAAQAEAERMMQALTANYSGGLQQQGYGVQTMAQLMDDLRNRALGTKGLNLEWAKLQEEIRNNNLQNEIQRHQLEAQKNQGGGIFSKIMGGLGLAGSLIPGIGSLASIGAYAGKK